MKKILTLIVLSLAIISCSNERTNEMPPNAQNEYDFLITENPNLGRPTPEKLIPIKKEIRTYFKKIGKKADDLLQWEERGPNNVGGRTRALMFDPNDATNKKVFAGGVSGGLWYNNDITNIESSWYNINDFWTSLGITCMTYDPNNSQIFYVGTGESSARSTRGGGLWKSIDGGVTWNNVALVLQNVGEVSQEAYYINDVVVRNNGGTSEVYMSVSEKYFEGEWFSTKVSGLWKSVDGGLNFMRVPLEAGEIVGTVNVPYDIELSSANDLWIGTIGSAFGDGPKGGKVFKSTDGTSFAKVFDMGSIAENVRQNRVEIAVAPSNANIVYVLIADEDRSGNLTMVKTLDGGTTWYDMPLPNGSATGLPANDFTRGQSFYDLILQVKPDDENYLIAGGIDLFFSTDATTIPVAPDPANGVESDNMSWNQLTQWYGGYDYPYSHADQHEIVFHPTNFNHVLFGSDGGVSTCYDLTSVNELGRINIDVLNKNYNVTQFYAGDIYKTDTEELLIAGAQDNGSQFFTESGMNSTVEVTGGDGAFCFIDDDSDIMITSYVYNNYRFLRKDGTFIKNFGAGDEGSFINPTDYDSKNDILISYANEGKINIYDVTKPIISASTKSVSGFSSEVFSHVKISPFRIDENKPDFFLGSTTGKVIYMKKVYGLFGIETEDLTSPDFEGAVSSIDVGSSTDELLVTFSNYGVKSVWYTIDGGTTWLDKESNLPDMPIRWGIFNKEDRKNVLLATELGVWETKDITLTTPVWYPVNEGLANVRVNMLKTTEFDNSVVAATYGRGLFTASLNGSPLAIDNVEFASNFNIYPNPIVSNRIYINSTAKNKVDAIEIYNVNGQLLIDKKFNKESKVEIDVESLSKGSYVLKLFSGDQQISKKVIVE